MQGLSWLCIFWFVMPGYAGMSTDSPEVITTTVGVSFYRGFLQRQENRL